jgi:hypothetical protein
MGDRKFTLLELHFDEGFQIGPKAMGVGSGGSDEDEAEDVDEAADADAGSDAPEGGPNPVAGLVGLLVLVAIAVAVRRLLGGDDEEFEQEELEEFEAA